ncbi:hypothetical protein SAMN05421538_108161 [Paracoccus isoporae]|uniref:Transcription factor zinc-finger domain-containing protein n=1 Tax=Paracoccus isoporae TaxID=591205 RepID=A0A1G7ECS7_9RHOB|nr:zf-TFIIB domain-containing protein [Paracoccus isoporae]SDE61266.1 hypothetical protein SAMN05421538_108161 [Paracoccus isoporae]
MKCPIDDETLLMTTRSGVEIDYCPKCRGVWLDRGELDKIIDKSVGEATPPVMLAQPAAEAQAAFGQPLRDPRDVDPAAWRRDRRDEDRRDTRHDDTGDRRRDRRDRFDDDEDDRDRRRRKKRKDSFLSELFDF